MARSIVFTVLSSISTITYAAATESNSLDSYFKVDAGLVVFDLPAYKDGFGVVGLAPVSGPFFVKGEYQVGVSLEMTGRHVTNQQIWSNRGLLFFEASGFYSKADDTYSSTLGSDLAGNNIRFGLFNGSNGYNSSNASQLIYRLSSEVEYYGGTASVGIETKRSRGKISYQIGPQLLRLDQHFSLRGTNPNGASFYNRDESLETRYLGARFSVAARRKISQHVAVDGEFGLSVLNMRAQYDGFDSVSFGGGSSLSLERNQTAFGVDLTVGASYVFASATKIGIKVGASYLDKVPEIVHPTGATASGNFVPASLKTGHMLTPTVGVEVTVPF